MARVPENQLDRPAPVVLFVYRRPEHTRRTLDALRMNTLASASELVVFCDGARSPQDAQGVKETRELVRRIDGFASVRVIERPHNFGLARSIVEGVSEVLAASDRVIVLEDDMLTATNFLTYCNDALDFYQNDQRISAISGYAYPIAIPADYPHHVVALRRGSPWGWATWKDRWQRIDWALSGAESLLRDRAARQRLRAFGEDLEIRLWQKLHNEIDAWSIVRTYSQFRRNELTIFPVVSKIHNIGCDASGQHFSVSTDRWNVSLDTSGQAVPLIENPCPQPLLDAAVANLFRVGRHARLRHELKLLVGCPRWYLRRLLE